MRENKMTLNERLWYVRLYFWSASICDEFTEGGMEWRARERGTNLCQFLRVIVVYMPAILLLHVALYGGAITAITAVPIYLMGMVWYFAVAGAVALIIGIVYAIKWYRRIQLRGAARNEAGTETKPAPVATPQPATSPSFGSIVWQWLVAQKQRVCPLINFNAQEHAS